LKPGWADAWVNRGAAHWAGGNLDTARRAFERALELDPGNAEARRSLTALAIERGDDADAGECGDWQICYNLGVLKQSRGQHEEAAALYRAVLDKNPQCAEARLNLGTAMMALGRALEANACWREALRDSPELAARLI
jgi:tetratricopeptide (TPR) repeat protein